MAKKPRIAFLVDYPNWAFDWVARSITARLSDRFSFQIQYSSRHPWITPRDTDLLYVFYWGYKVPMEAGFAKEQVIKEVASWGWELTHRHDKLTKEEFVGRYLDDCAVVTTPCAAIYRELKSTFPRVVHCPNGVEHAYFAERAGGCIPRGELKIGWVGNPQDEHKVKGLHEILLPAAEGYAFTYSSGQMTRRQLKKFYESIDVLAIGSLSESQPLPLLEAMSAGCFPVTTNVGIVPEIIRNGKNGLIVERSVASFREAFSWCSDNISRLRERRHEQSEWAAGQSWDAWAPRFGDLFDSVLAGAELGEFRPPAGLVGVVDRARHSPAQQTRRTRIAYLICAMGARLSCASRDAKDAIRRWFLGDRFKKAPGDAIYQWFSRQAGWYRAVKLRFSELVHEEGFFSAVATALKSFLKRVSL